MRYPSAATFYRRVIRTIRRREIQIFFSNKLNKDAVSCTYALLKIKKKKNGKYVTTTVKKVIQLLFNPNDEQFLLLDIIYGFVRAFYPELGPKQASAWAKVLRCDLSKKQKEVLCERVCTAAKWVPLPTTIHKRVLRELRRGNYLIILTRRMKAHCARLWRAEKIIKINPDKDEAVASLLHEFIHAFYGHIPEEVVRPLEILVYGSLSERQVEHLEQQLEEIDDIQKELKAKRHKRRK